MTSGRLKRRGFLALVFIIKLKIYQMNAHFIIARSPFGFLMPTETNHTNAIQTGKRCTCWHMRSQPIGYYMIPSFAH